MKLKQSLESTQNILTNVKATLIAQKKTARAEAAAANAASGSQGHDTEEMAAIAEARLKEAEALKQQLAVTEEEKSQLSASLEATQKNLEEVEAALATQERLVVSVGKAVVARKTREEEMTLLLKNVTAEKIRLAADTAHLEASLSQQTNIATNLGKMVGRGRGNRGKESMKESEQLLDGLDPTLPVELSRWCRGLSRNKTEISTSWVML